MRSLQKPMLKDFDLGKAVGESVVLNWSVPTYKYRSRGMHASENTDVHTRCQAASIGKVIGKTRAFSSAIILVSTLFVVSRSAPFKSAAYRLLTFIISRIKYGRRSRHPGQWSRNTGLLKIRIVSTRSLPLHLTQVRIINKLEIEIKIWY